MKVVIYGNQEDAILRVERLLEEMAKTLNVNLRKENVVCIYDRINGLSIADLVEEDNVQDDNGYKIAIFLGNAPTDEVKLALQHGMRVLLILAPTDQQFNRNVIVGQTTNATKESSLNKDLVKSLSKFVNAGVERDVG